MDLFLCASSILFCKVMIEASPFSLLEHSTSFARELWFNTLPIQSWLDTFSAHRHIGDAITIAHGDIRTGLLQFAIKYHKKFGFGFVTSTNLFLLQQILEEVQACYQNSLQVELEIVSREEFTLIEKGLTKLWERLAREETQEVPEETGEIVQDSMLEEDVVPDSSDEVVSKGHQPSITTFDLNKTPKENDIC
nr:uric acid degradation bifunctional protein TTL isoform X2 [Arachis hypogaea]